MTVSELIYRLENFCPNKNLPVFVMQEQEVKERPKTVVQFESLVTDVGHTSTSVIIIGQELLIAERDKE